MIQNDNERVSTDCSDQSTCSRPASYTVSIISAHLMSKSEVKCFSRPALPVLVDCRAPCSFELGFRHGVASTSDHKLTVVSRPGTSPPTALKDCHTRVCLSAVNLVHARKRHGPTELRLVRSTRTELDGSSEHVQTNCK